MNCTELDHEEAACLSGPSQQIIHRPEMSAFQDSIFLRICMKIGDGAVSRAVLEAEWIHQTGALFSNYVLVLCRL
jgi:hypothetical protein